MNRVRAILVKELLEARKNKMIVMTMSILPVMILAISLGTLWAIQSNIGGDALKGGSSGLPDYLKGLDPKDAMGILMVSQYLFLFLVVPASIPVSIASYSSPDRASGGNNVGFRGQQPESLQHQRCNDSKARRNSPGTRSTKTRRAVGDRGPIVSGRIRSGASGV